MSLNGNLQDFGISHILQIISQEGKSGQLTLQSSNTEGYMIFKEGNIIFSDISGMSIENMVLRYLSKIIKLPQQEIKELKNMYQNHLAALTKELLSKKYLPENDLLYIIENGIEDIACELFAFQKGNYVFKSIKNVDQYQIGDFSIPCDSLTMEAARRLDEWQRMAKNIKPNTVFLRNNSNHSGKTDVSEISPIDDFTEYLLYFKINGISSVKTIWMNTFFSRYKVYESLNELLNAGKISPLSDTLSTSVNQAVKRSENQLDRKVAATILSFFIVLIISFLFFFSGQIVLKKDVLGNSSAKRSEMITGLAEYNNTRKYKIAKQLHIIRYGEKFKPSDLIKHNYLSNKDLWFLDIETEENENIEQ